MESYEDPSNSFMWFCGKLKGAYWDFFLPEIYVYFWGLYCAWKAVPAVDCHLSHVCDKKPLKKAEIWERH